MLLSGAWGEVIHEKNLKQKISWHCPFNPFSYAKRHLRNIKGSEQREVKGLSKVANEKYMTWTVVIIIFLNFIVDLTPFLKKHICVSAHPSPVIRRWSDDKYSNGAAN